VNNEGMAQEEKHENADEGEEAEGNTNEVSAIVAS